MDVSFMTHFIQSKEGEVLDSTKLNYDIQALTRLNGITKATFGIDTNTLNRHEQHHTNSNSE